MASNAYGPFSQGSFPPAVPLLSMPVLSAPRRPALLWSRAVLRAGMKDTWTNTPFLWNLYFVNLARSVRSSRHYLPSTIACLENKSAGPGSPQFHEAWPNREDRSPPQQHFGLPAVRSASELSSGDAEGLAVVPQFPLAP